MLVSNEAGRNLVHLHGVTGMLIIKDALKAVFMVRISKSSLPEFLSRRPFSVKRGSLILLVPVWILVGCSTFQLPSRAAGAICSLDLQSDFSQERVIVFADNERVFLGFVTTEPTTGLAKHLSIPTEHSRLQLRIEIPAARAVLVKSVDLRQGRYFGLSRSYGRLKLEQRVTPFFYD